MRFPPCLALACSLLTACGSKVTPTPEREAPTSASVPAVPASASAATARPAPPKVAPTLVAHEFKPKGSRPTEIYRIGGALVVTEGRKVGRIVGETIEWGGSIPEGSEALGGTRITSVSGR